MIEDATNKLNEQIQQAHEFIREVTPMLKQWDKIQSASPLLPRTKYHQVNYGPTVKGLLIKHQKYLESLGIK